MSLLNVFPLQSIGTLELGYLMPLIILSFGAVAALIGGTNKVNGHKIAFGISFVTLMISLILCANTILNPLTVLLGGVLQFTTFTKSLSFMSLFFSLIAVLLTYGLDKREGMLSEIYGLILFATAGMILMVSSEHLLFMFIALQIMSLAVYVLVAMRRTSSFSAEAGLKYFILGGFASALFLYGSALVFGATGSFQLQVIGTAITKSSPSIIYFIGVGLILAAMLFKVGAFPFHGWVPDVYQGAATNITGFMGASVKFTAFMALANITNNLIFKEVAGLEWFQNIIWMASAASMIYGNFVAISQTEIKRMLSFSTIAHTGYLLMGLYAMNGTVESTQSLVLYLFFYALTNLGAFAVVSMFEKQNQKDTTLEDLSGLGLKYPLQGALLTLFLLSMAGIPLTSGFIGKYGLFNSAIAAGEVPLVVIAVLSSVVSVYYYLRVIVYLFMKEANGAHAGISTHWRGASIAALFSAAMTLQFGLFPKMIVQFVKMLAK